MSGGSFTLSVTPEIGLLTERRRVRVIGAVPGSLVTLRSETLRGDELWAAQVTLVVDAAGSVDLDESAPVSGDFRVADAMGLFWAQRRETHNGGSSEPHDVTAPLVTRLRAWAEPGTGYLDVPGLGVVAPAGPEHAVEVRIEQHLLAAEVLRTEVRSDGLVGTLFRPAGEGPFPTLIVMNGSGGGINEARAALYAAEGIQALALGYFRVPGLSHFISRTPLEYFERALDYVTRELDPQGGAALVSGQSRGGELTLLLAARYPERIIGAVAFVPGAFVFGAQGAADPSDGWNGPTWTAAGDPLEHLWHDNSGVTWQPWDDAPAPTRHADVYVDGLHDRELARSARIPIERFSGPVACISGLDDRAWPSSYASRLALDTLARHGHTAERLHLDYVDAGHGITIPHLPSTEIARTHPVSGVHYSNGGTPQGNARASAESFAAVCAFVHRTAKARAAQHHFSQTSETKEN
ncbi:acyl-CoA thioester hydrolase/bile acid acetyltransferase-like protein [Leucobacter luti]|uniref:Acyl-CoA thioester hydrolase/bile acid acetyltransferase-like protein n=1 Tax=Leucobacter luti TaxID=340320 RepID=A0A4V3CXG4_9MICO|nr:acyl-CoA thioesterase/bile acid-CoA:amino acid N-acyltransferase family protein [Leucobacter luti]TDP90188.1 acyl-CoA thioester hydrolase/bile acid acetyltransferase-like protein [Leucobacter luti]